MRWVGWQGPWQNGNDRRWQSILEPRAKRQRVSPPSRAEPQPGSRLMAGHWSAANDTVMEVDGDACKTNGDSLNDSAAPQDAQTKARAKAHIPGIMKNVAMYILC